MTRPVLILAMLIAFAASRCDEARSPLDRPKPKIGDSVKLRGTIAEDVDCRLLRIDDGTVYSLTGRVPALRSGDRVCVTGTLIATSQCLTQPTVEVDGVTSWSSCP
ncbi:MAG: DUF5818 domain-containing protein [Candidatus Eisenbacteria bacterium]